VLLGLDRGPPQQDVVLLLKALYILYGGVNMNKNRLKVVSIIGFILMMLVVGGCGAGGGAQQTGGQPSASQPGDASSEDSNKSGDVKQLKIATATTTGAFYPIGGVMASILSKNLDGYNFTAEATGGSVENARLIQSGQDQIGIFGGDTLYDAYNGEGPFKDKPVKLAGLATIYGNPFHVVVLKNSGIKTIADLKGKKVAVGAPGSGTSNKAKVLLEEYGLKFDKDIKPEYLDFQEGSDALVDGNVDAVIISVGLPSGNVQELGTTHEIDLVAFDQAKGEEIAKKYPYFSTFTIPAGTYKGIDHDVLTMTAPNYIAVDPNLSEDLVYQMTKALFGDHFDEFKASHAAMKDVTLEEAPLTNIPLHPGAEKFYKEAGVLK
jgi:hypothetical protein